METLFLIGLIILGLIIVIGLIRVMFTPYTGFLNLLMEMVFIDFLIDGLFWVIESISDLTD